MKIKVNTDCVGIGYNLKKGETAELDKKTAEKLIHFGYAEEIKQQTRKAKEKVPE